MPVLNACDFAYPPSNVSIEDFYHRLYAAGIRAVQRYLWVGGKGITSREKAAAKAAGIFAAYGYEGYASNWRGGAQQGAADRDRAVPIAQGLGLPKGTPIYYAVDEDAAGLGMLATAVAYVHAANHPDYPSRPYGSYAVVEALRLPAFQTYAWSGGQVSKYAALYQWRNGQTLAGGTVDYCEIRDPVALGLVHPTPTDALMEEIMSYYKDKADFEDSMARLMDRSNTTSRGLFRKMLGYAVVVIRSGHEVGWFSRKNIPGAFPKAGAK